MSLHALILAAGRGSRFAGVKQLAMIAGQTMLQRAADLAESITPDHMTVILGFEYEQLSALVKPEHVFVNPQWHAGIGSSIACGVAGLPASASAVLIYLCDQVALTKADLQRLRIAYDEEKSHIVCAAYVGGLGVPAIFPRTYFPQLISLEGDKGAKQLLYANPVLSVPMESAAIDIDTYEQWVQFTASPFEPKTTNSERGNHQ